MLDGALESSTARGKKPCRSSAQFESYGGKEKAGRGGHRGPGHRGLCQSRRVEWARLSDGVGTVSEVTWSGFPRRRDRDCGEGRSQGSKGNREHLSDGVRVPRSSGGECF